MSIWLARDMQNLQAKWLREHPKKSHMIEGILGGLVSEVARILEVCKQSRKPAQHQIYQSDGFFTFGSRQDELTQSAAQE